MKSVAILKKYPTSPRKARLVVDLIRGMDVVKALDLLKHDTREISHPIEKLLLSSISNWQNKNTDASSNDASLYISEIRVDGAGMLKRIKPAPQGRAHKIRKRFNHITIVIDTKSPNDETNKEIITKSDSKAKEDKKNTQKIIENKSIKSNTKKTISKTDIKKTKTLEDNKKVDNDTK